MSICGTPGATSCAGDQASPTPGPAYGEVIASWAEWTPPRSLEVTASAQTCRASWEAGTPLVAEAAGPLRAVDPPLVEDWGSPHLDLIARRHGYWRPDAPVVSTGYRERPA